MLQDALRALERLHQARVDGSRSSRAGRAGDKLADAARHQIEFRIGGEESGELAGVGNAAAAVVLDAGGESGARIGTGKALLERVGVILCTRRAVLAGDAGGRLDLVVVD